MRGFSFYRGELESQSQAVCLSVCLYLSASTLAQGREKRMRLQVVKLAIAHQSQAKEGRDNEMQKDIGAAGWPHFSRMAIKPRRRMMIGNREMQQLHDSKAVQIGFLSCAWKSIEGSAESVANPNYSFLAPRPFLRLRLLLRLRVMPPPPALAQFPLGAAARLTPGHAIADSPRPLRGPEYGVRQL